jgi:hypothetical protein
LFSSILDIAACDSLINLDWVFGREFAPARGSRFFLLDWLSLNGFVFVSLLAIFFFTAFLPILRNNE